MRKRRIAGEARRGFLGSLRVAHSQLRARARFRLLLFAAILILFMGPLLMLLLWSLLSAHLGAQHWVWYLILSVCLGVWSTLLFKLFSLMRSQDERLVQLEDQELMLSMRSEQIALDDGVLRGEILSFPDQGFGRSERLQKGLSQGISPTKPSGSPQNHDEDQVEPLLLVSTLLRALPLRKKQRELKASFQRPASEPPIPEAESALETAVDGPAGGTLPAAFDVEPDSD